MGKFYKILMKGGNMNRRNLLKLTGLALIGNLMGRPFMVQAQNRKDGMDALMAIKTRHSIRSYSKAPVSDEIIRELLHCAMSAPSAHGEDPWEFIVVKDKNLLSEIADRNSNVSFAKNAPVGILVCLDEDKQQNKGYGVEAVSCAAENILIAANALGLGACWTEAWPIEKRVKNYRDIFDLSKNILPICFIVVGHLTSRNSSVQSFDENKVHFDRW